VPCCTSEVAVRMRIDPPFLRTVSFTSHKPRPVPVSDLVVKNGSHIFSLCSGDMPGPESAIETSTQVVAVRQSRLSRISIVI
jgi:hypothetical protein